MQLKVYKTIMSKKGERVEIDEDKLSDVLEGKEEKHDPMECGMKKERKEHPLLKEEIIKIIVSDHLKEDPDYYKEETE